MSEVLRDWWSSGVHVVESHCGDYTAVVLFVVCTQLLHLTTFWLHCLALAVIDLNPSFFKSFARWKTQQGVHVTPARYRRAVEVALFNQFAVNIPFAFVTFFAYQWRGLQYDAETLPSWGTILRDFVGFLVIEEIFFYYGHLWMHLPRYYKRFHKQHHEFTAPVGVACIYAHPVEHVLCNLLPIVLGPFVMHSHLFTYWMWLTFAVFSTITSHSGYHFPFLLSSERHDYHHLRFDVNYGPTGALDIMNNTDSLFKGTQQEKRNRIFWKLSDVKYMEQVEGNNKRKSK